jgi:pimeloyl-ACP methyl ester carboxylesterase
MATRILRQFAAVMGRQVHYRRAGHGPPVLLLHQTPTSSRECEPMMRRLAQRHSVFAPDMPGYGASDPLAQPISSIEELADRVALFMDALGIERAGIFGFHTGASIANAFARRHAHRVAVAVMVGLMCLDADERGDMLQHYAPNFVARWDGAHLAWAWSRLKDQSVFFPWYRRTAAGRMTMDASEPMVIQAALNDWLRSGERYGDAYRAAFRYQPERDLPHIGTPHFILGYPSDPLSSHLQRLPPLPAAACIRRHATAAEAQSDACELLHRFVGTFLSGVTAPTRPTGHPCPQDYLDVSGLQLRTLRAGDADHPPLLLLHGAQSSVTAWRELIVALGESRSVVALELPGHGESDALADLGDYTIENLADLVDDALKSLGLPPFACVGMEAGAAILTVLAARGEASVASLHVLNAIDVAEDRDLCEQLLASYPPAVAPDFFGGHLLRAWHEARDHALFFPWYERSSQCAIREDGGAPQGGAPHGGAAQAGAAHEDGFHALAADLLHRQAVDALLAGASGYAIRRAEVNCALTARLANRKCPARGAAGRWSPRFTRSQALAAASGMEFRPLPRDARGCAVALTGPRDA